MRCLPIGVTRILVVCISSVLYLLVYYHRIWPSILTHELAFAYNVTEAQIGIFSSMYFWPYAILQPFSGVLADGLEPAFLMAGASSLSAIGSIVIALTNDFSVACFGRVLIGFGCGPIIVPVCRILANWFSPRNFYYIQGLVHVFGAVGGILAQGPLMSVIQYVTWESTFYFVASLGFVNVILVLVFVRGNPAAAGYETSSLLGGPADSLETSERFSVPLLRAKSVPLSFRQRFFEKMAELWMNTKICLLNKYFWTLTLMNSLIPGAFYNFTGAWGGPYLRDVFSYSESQAAYILVLLNIAYIAGTPILSLISEAIHSRKYVICVTGVCASGLSIGFLLLPSTSTRVVVMLLIFSLGFFTTGATSTMITMFKELDSVEVSGTMIGWSNFFPFMATTILQIVGTVVLEAVDRDGNPGDPHSFRGFQLALWVPTVICCTLGTVGIFISKDTYPKADDYITLSGK